MIVQVDAEASKCRDDKQSYHHRGNWRLDRNQYATYDPDHDDGSNAEIQDAPGTKCAPFQIAHTRHKINEQELIFTYQKIFVVKLAWR